MEATIRMIEAVGMPETTGAPEVVGMPEVVGATGMSGMTGMPGTAETTGMAGTPDTIETIGTTGAATMPMACCPGRKRSATGRPSSSCCSSPGSSWCSPRRGTPRSSPSPPPGTRSSRWRGCVVRGRGVGASRRDLLALLPHRELARAAAHRARGRRTPARGDASGARLLGIGSLSAAGVVFVVVALAHGLLRRALAHLLVARSRRREPAGTSGRTALMGGTRWACSAPPPRCSWPFAITATAGARWAGTDAAPALRRFVVSIVPIAFGYHFAHYLPSFLVDAQYALKALSDPAGPRLEPARSARPPRHRLLPHPPRIGRDHLVRAGRRDRGRARGRGSGPARPCGGVRARAAGAGPGRASAHRADDRLHPVRALAAVDPRRRLSLRRGSRRRGVL